MCLSLLYLIPNVQLYWSSCLFFTFIACGIMQMNHDIWWSNNRDYRVISGPATSDLQLETMWIHLPLYEIQIKVVIRGILSIMGITCRHAEKRFSLMSLACSFLFKINENKCALPWILKPEQKDGKTEQCCLTW